jgi:hypothetical protein
MPLRGGLADDLAGMSQEGPLCGTDGFQSRYSGTNDKHFRRCDGAGRRHQ